MSGLDGCVNSRIRQIVILFRKCLAIKEAMSYGTVFLEVGRSIFILEDSYFLINDRNVFSLCLAECSDYDLYELALKPHELGVNSESEFYFVKEMKGGGSQTESVTQNTMRYSYRKEGDLIPAYMSHELGEILPSMINISKSKIWDDWLQLTQYFPNKDSEYYEAAYVRYDAYNPQTEVYSGFGDTEVESRAMPLIDLLDKKVLTLSDLKLKSLNRI